MSKVSFQILTSLVVLISITGTGPSLASTAGLPSHSETPPPEHPYKLNDPDWPGAVECPCKSTDAEIEVNKATPTGPESTGGPDQFGYTWSDSAAFNWIDATSGVNAGLSDADDDIAGPFNIGFNFKYYENSYSQLYVTSNGLVSFDEGAWSFSNLEIPNLSEPNNIIAPFWDDLCVNYAGYNSGAVYYKSGGAAPNRYFVVEWHEISRLYYSDRITFEVILHENGDIVMQYLSMNGYLASATVGIEDASGIDGLEYLYNNYGMSNNKAVRFYRPAPAARVTIWPRYYGQFTQTLEPAVYQVPVRNTGELGTDTYDVTISTGWPAALFAADGVTPLTDSNSSGTIDTGPIPQGGSTSLVARVTRPYPTTVGEDNTAILTFRSSIDSSKSTTATLQAAVPAPFIQAYTDISEAAQQLIMVQPAGQVPFPVTSDQVNAYYLATAETQDGAAYVWIENHTYNGYQTHEIRYGLVDRYDQGIHQEYRLTDHTAATMRISDYNPTLAVAPDGRIGITWYRYLYQTDVGYNYNIFFSGLDRAGKTLLPPVNLTNNTAWGYG
jgi:hypothetical protein